MVLDGRPTLRTPDGEREPRAGDTAIGARKPRQKLEWAEDGREEVLLRVAGGEHEAPGVVDGRQRDGTQSAGSAGGTWPRKTGTTRVANAPAGRASISGRSWSKASSRHRLGAIW